MEAEIQYLNPDIRARVLKALDPRRPRTITDIAKRAATSRIAAVRHLEQLIREGMATEFAMHPKLRLFVLAEEEAGRGDAG